MRSRTGGDLFLYDQAEANPSGDGNSYQQVKTPVDKKVPPGHGEPEKHLDDANPASSRVVPEKMASALVLRPAGWNATSDDGFAFLNSLSRPGIVFRGMTESEFKATVGAGRPVFSTGRHSHHSEGTNFAESAADAESYVNFGRDDPRKTGRPNYLVEVARIPEMENASDGYVKSPVPVDTVRRVWVFESEGDTVVIRPLRGGRTAATISDILTATDQDVHQRATGVQVSPKRFNPKSGFWVFQCTGSKGETYLIRLKGIRKGKTVSLSKAQIQVSCSCNFFQWQGPEHWAQVNGYLYGKPRGTASKPVIKDPPGTHWACKHVLAALELAKSYRFSSEDRWSFAGEITPLPDPRRVARRYAGLNNLKPNEIVTVYHGTRLSHVPGFINGFDANRPMPRVFGGPRHAGVFVSPSPDLAEEFSPYGEVVLEISVQAKNLHGTDYSGNIGNDQDGSAEYPDSFRPSLSRTMLQSSEPQALLRGLVRPSQIKRVRYKPPSGSPVWYSRRDFLGLGLEAPEAYGPKKIVDVGMDLSSPNLTPDEFVRGLGLYLDLTPAESRDVLRETLESEGISGIEELMLAAGFGPTAIRSFRVLVERGRMSEIPR